MEAPCSVYVAIGWFKISPVMVTLNEDITGGGGQNINGSLMSSISVVSANRAEYDQCVVSRKVPNAEHRSD